MMKQNKTKLNVDPYMLQPKRIGLRNGYATIRQNYHHEIKMYVYVHMCPGALFITCYEIVHLYYLLAINSLILFIISIHFSIKSMHQYYFYCQYYNIIIDDDDDDDDDYDDDDYDNKTLKFSYKL